MTSDERSFDSYFNSAHDKNWSISGHFHVTDIYKPSGIREEAEEKNICNKSASGDLSTLIVFEEQIHATGH